MTYNFHEDIKLSLWESIYYYFHKKIFHYRGKNQVYFDNKFIISVGNLTTGGTGKTPLSIYLADEFLKKKHNVLVCLRGYKGTFKDELLVAENGQILTTSYISGDEAYLIAFKLKEKHHKNFRIACGKDRSKLIRKYGEGYNIVILDDAFQNPTVYRNLDIITLDVTDPPNNVHLIPKGKFREPLTAIKRSDIVIFTRTQENPESLKQWEKIVQSYEKPFFYSNHIQENPIPLVKKSEIVAVCGIGKPDSFLKMLEIDFKIIKSYVYKDHHQFTNYEIQEWLKHKKPIVLTEKDWVRLLYNPIYLQNKDRFYRYSIKIEIKNKNHFINLINKNLKEFSNYG